jgi:hypothetical protein
VRCSSIGPIIDKWQDEAKNRFFEDRDDDDGSNDQGDAVWVKQKKERHGSTIPSSDQGPRPRLRLTRPESGCRLLLSAAMPSIAIVYRSFLIQLDTRFSISRSLSLSKHLGGFRTQKAMMMIVPSY